MLVAERNRLVDGDTCLTDVVDAVDVQQNAKQHRALLYAAATHPHGLRRLRLFNRLSMINVGREVAECVGGRDLTVHNPIGRVCAPILGQLADERRWRRHCGARILPRLRS